MEHKKEDLDGDIELNVVLPNSSIVSFTVKRRLPLMDLLVLVSSKHHLKPSEHMIQAISENNTIIRSTPNTCVGTLKARYIQILQKHILEEPQPAPPIAPPRRNVLPNISSTLPPKHKPDVKSLDPQKLLLSFRLLVHLPNNQLYVMRVTPDMTINDILVTVQDAKNLNVNNFSIRNKHNPETELDLNNTLAHYQIKELILERKTPVPLTQSRTSLQPTDPSTSSFKSGLKSFFTNLKLSSGKNRHKLSIREAQIKQPVLQKKVQNVFYKEPESTPQDTNVTVITPINRPKPPPRKRHAPPPPVQQIKNTEIVTSQTTNKSPVGNGVIIQEALPVLPNSDDFQNCVQRDTDTKEVQKKQLVRQLAVVSTSSSIESAKEENPKIILNQTIQFENSDKHIIESDINNHLRSDSQSVSHGMVHSEVSNNMNIGECSHPVGTIYQQEEYSHNALDSFMKDAQYLSNNTENTENECSVSNCTHDTKKMESYEQMTGNQYLHCPELENKTPENVKVNYEKMNQTNTIEETLELGEYSELPEGSEMSSTNFASNVKRTDQSTQYLVNEMEMKKAESGLISPQTCVIDNNSNKNTTENINISVINNDEKKEKLQDENLQNTEVTMKIFINKEELFEEEVKNIDKVEMMNVSNKNNIIYNNPNNGEQITEKCVIKADELEKATQKTKIDRLIKESDAQNDRRYHAQNDKHVQGKMNSSTTIFAGGNRSSNENVQSSLPDRGETSQQTTSSIKKSINNYENRGVLFGTHNLNLSTNKLKNIKNDKINFLDDKKPVSKASSELNVSAIGQHAPRFLLTSWSSDKVPKVIRIADDTTHGSSAYTQNIPSVSSMDRNKQLTAEKTFSEEPLLSQMEKSFTRPVVVSVLHKDPNSNSSHINNQNGNMEKVHHDISIKCNKEKMITSKSTTSSYTARAISTPPKIQSWELVNAIEKMLKKKSPNGTDNSSRNIENVESGNEGNKYFNNIPFKLFTYIPQTGKPSYFQIIAQNEYIRSKIPLELGEQSKRSSNESLPLINDYGSGSHDKKN